MNGNAIIVGGIQIGTLTPVVGGASLQLALNANATPARVQSVVRNLTFRSSATASAGARTVTVQLSDGDGGTSSVAQQTVNVSQPSPPSPCAGKPTVTRPNVRLQPFARGGRLEVTVEAAPIDGQTNNAIVSLRFGQFQNARVTLQGGPVASGATVTLPSNTVAATFTVERQTPGQVTHVPFIVTDRCGAWETFVGGGANAGF